MLKTAAPVNMSRLHKLSNDLSQAVQCLFLTSGPRTSAAGRCRRAPADVGRAVGAGGVAATWPPTQTALTDEVSPPQKFSAHLVPNSTKEISTLYEELGLSGS